MECEKGKAIPVELGQVYRNENLKEIYYVFVPETTGKYVVKERSTIYDENWKEIERKSDVAAVQMEAGKLITLQWKLDIGVSKNMWQANRKQ